MIERGSEVLGYSESWIAPRSNKNDRRWSVSGTHLLDKWAGVPTYNSLSHAILNLTYRSDGAEGGTLSRGMAWNEARFFHTPKPRRILHRWENERGYYAKCYLLCFAWHRIRKKHELSGRMVEETSGYQPGRTADRYFYPLCARRRTVFSFRSI